MTWRVGHKVPINIYAGDRPVCQCHSAEDALAIVSAVNRIAAIERECDDYVTWVPALDRIRAILREES
jgi:hypothetical protein